jgi:hypothetical protein
MTATVSLFTFSGLTTLPVVSGQVQRSDSVMAVKEPVLGRDLLSCTTGAADASESSAAPARTEVVHLQVQSGKRVYYEIIPSGHAAVTASSTSRIMEGNHTIPWGPGWTISVLEVA